MLKCIVLILGLFASNIVYSQKQVDLDSIHRTLSKTHKKTLRIFKVSGDSSTLIIGYKKSTYDLLGVQILVKKRAIDVQFSNLHQYTYHFMPDSTIFITVLAEHSDKRHYGKAKYLFKNYQLLLKEEDKYIEQDYSSLITKSEFYKEIASRRIKEKFSN